jgi:hypothetical protein
MHQPSTAALVRSGTTSSSRPRSRSTRPVTHRVGARRVALRNLSRPGQAPPPRPSDQGPPPAAGHDPPPPASPSPIQHPGRGPPRPRHGRPCRPAGRPRPGPVRSAPPAERSQPPARSRSVPCRLAHDSARSIYATTAPSDGHRSAGHVPAPRVGRARWRARRNPHSRPWWPSSGRRVAIRRLPVRPRRPRSRPGPAAAPKVTTLLTHRGLLLADVRHPQGMRVPGPSEAPYVTVGRAPHHAS